MAAEFMRWEPAFNLGIENIDEQHKKIVKFINELNDAVEAGQSEDKIEAILNGMSEYAAYHFSTEEEYFRAHSFPLIDEHLKQHESFIEKIREFQSKFDEGQAITFRLLNFLRTWLSNHILDSDREYVDLIKSEINMRK